MTTTFDTSRSENIMLCQGEGFCMHVFSSLYCLLQKPYFILLYLTNLHIVDAYTSMISKLVRKYGRTIMSVISGQVACRTVCVRIDLEYDMWMRH